MTGSEVTLMQNGGLQVEELAQGGSLADGAGLPGLESIPAEQLSLLY